MDMETLVGRLQAVWKEEKGEKLSYSKAKRRIENAVAHGCTMSERCLDCKNVRCCPLLADEGKEG